MAKHDPEVCMREAREWWADYQIGHAYVEGMVWLWLFRRAGMPA